MADSELKENNETKAKYKFGQNEIDYDLYIKNLSNNVQNYIASKNWSEGQILAFTRAYNEFINGLTNLKDSNSSRLYTDEFGTIFDTDSIIDKNKENYWVDSEGNLYKDLNEIAKRKDRNNATQFSAYRELAGYANIIGKGILNKLAEREATPTKQTDNLFDFNKHGFEEYFGTQINPAGIDFKQNPAALSSFYEMDPYNKATGKRALTNRAAYFKEILQQYKAQLGDYDFSNTAYKTKENYLSLIDATINGLNDGVINDLDKRNLMQLGVRPDTFLGFFDTRENPNISKEEQDAINALNEETANTSKVNQLRLQFGDNSLNTFNQIKGPKYINDSQTDTWIRINFGLNPNINENELDYELIQKYGYLFPNLRQPAVPKLGESLEQANTRIALENEQLIKNNYESFIRSFLNYFRNNPKSSTFNINGKTINRSEAILTFINLTTFLDKSEPGYVWKPTNSSYLGAGDFYFIEDPVNDQKTHSVLVWDKATNRLFYTWALYVPESKAGQYLADQGKSAINPDINNDVPYAGLYEIGGSILTLLQGGFVPSSFKSTYGQEILERANKEGNSLSREAEGYRVVASRNNTQNLTPENPESYFTTADWARIGAIGLDIASMFTEPVSGAAIGLTSTATNAVADFGDKSLSTGQAVKNTLANLGMDAIALLPGGEVFKVSRNLSKIVPKLVKFFTVVPAGYSILATVQNGDEILKTLSKVGKEKLTVNDWQNVAQAISLLTGIKRAGTSHVRAHNAKKEAAVDDQLGLGIKRADGKTEDIILEGKHALKMREFAANNDVAGANRYLASIEGYKDAKVNTIADLHKPVHGIWTRAKVRKEKAEEYKGWTNAFSPVSEYTKAIDAFNIYDPKKFQRDNLSSARHHWQLDIINGQKTYNTPLSWIEPNPAGYRSSKVREAYALRNARPQSETILPANIGSLVQNAKRLKDDMKKAKDAIARIQKDKNNWTKDGRLTKNALKKIDIILSRINEINRKLNPTNAARQDWSNFLDPESYKLGGNIAKVRFMLNGGSSVNYSSLIDEYLKSLNAAQGIKYDLSYNQVGNRTWTNFNNATEGDYANDVAYQEIITGDPKFAFANTSKTDLAKALEETSAFKLFNQYLHNKHNAIDYFTAISLSNNAPQAAKLYANTQLKALRGISTDNLTDEQWNTLFKARQDKKPGTYYYTPVALTPSNTLSFYYNESSKTFEPVSDEMDLTQFASDTRYYTTQDGTYTESTFYYPNSSGNTLTTGTKSNNGKKGTDATVPDDDKGKSQQEGTTGLKAKLSRFLPYAMDLGRILQLNDVNRHLADIKAESLVPYLQNPSEFYLPVLGNLRAVLEGNQAAAILNKKGNEALTSDASLQLATALQAASMGNEYIQTGNKSDAEMIRDTAEKSTAQSKENMENRHKTAALNRLSLLQTLSNLKDLEQATYSHNANNWDIFFQSLVKDAKTAQTKQEQRQLAYDLQQYLDDLLQNPTKYIKRQWDPLFIEVLNNPSKQLTEEERLIVANEAALYNKILKWLAATRQGIYAERPNEVPLTFKEVISVKKGGTISKERIRAKIKDADRFHDSVKELIKEHNKKQDRVAKSMYRYPKVKVV